MKMTFDVPDGFLGCGITMVYENDERCVCMYSTSVTPDDVAAEKVLVLPREVTE